MTIQDVGSLGELVAAVATLGTLAYLAIQIRQSGRVSGLAAAHSVQNEINRFQERFTTDPTLYRIWVLGLHSPDELDEVSRDRFGRLFALFLTKLEDAHRHADLDPDIATRADHLGRYYFQMAEVQAWWTRQSEIMRRMNPMLHSYIENELLDRSAA